MSSDYMAVPKESSSRCESLADEAVFSRNDCKWEATAKTGGFLTFIEINKPILDGAHCSSSVGYRFLLGCQN